MDQYRTQPFEPEPELAYDEWDYQDPRPKILWGRVAVLGGALLVAFFLGRALAPDGIQPSQLTTAREARDQALADVERLTTELRRTERQLEDLRNSPQPQTQPTPQPSESPTLYTVKPGDTLIDLALQFYDDETLVTLIVAENPGLGPNSKLNVGDTLIIPPKP